MIKVKKLIAFIMALVLVLSVTVVGSFAEQKAAPLFTINDVETRQSEEFDVTIKFAQDIKPSEINIAALDVTLNYNSDVFTVVQVVKGEGLNAAFAKLANSTKLHLETGDYIYGASFKEEGKVNFALSTMDGFTFEKDTDFVVITFKAKDFANLEGDNNMYLEVTNAATKLEGGKSKDTTALYTPVSNNVKVDINLATLCDWDLDASKKTYTLAKFKDKDATYFNIPEEYDAENGIGAMPVTKIKYGAFSSTSKLQEVVLPESVKTIDSGAFFNCSGLRKVTIYGEDVSIGSLAFLGSKSNLVIKCKKGSTADKFAKNNGIKVEYFEDISSCTYKGADEAKYYIGTPVTLTNLKLYNTSGSLLKEGKDYNLEYENNTEIGTATVHVIGAGEYPGSFDIQFNVLCPYHTEGSEYYTETAIYANCAEGGKLHKQCTYCGYTDDSEVLPPKDHGEKEWKVTLEPTCQKVGKEECVCPDCNVSSGERDVPVIPCDMQMSYIKEPTCKEPGEGQYVCTMCGRAEPKQELPIVDHDYQWVTVKEATCLENGKAELACRFCGKVKETKVIECRGSHELADWVTIKEPTCTEDGYKQKVCSVCGEVVEKVDLSKTGHTEAEEAVIVAATCEKDGTSSKVCATCGEVLSSEVIPATGHKKSEWKVIDEPSCGVYGKEGIVCENCGLEYETKLIEPLTHEPSDEYTTIKEPTCTDSGIIGIVCKHCGTGKVYERKIVEAKGHEFSDWEYAVAPTCLEEGLRQRTCSACGETEIEIAPATGHKEVYVPEVRPTYRTTGVEKLVCEYCGRDYHKSRVMPKVNPDLDKNGTVSSADALMILQHSVELILLKEDELKDADCNGDGNVNSTDALLVLQLATGIITAD